jgi:hypothetical protein
LPEKSAQPLHVSGGGFLTLVQLVRVAGQQISPPSLGILAQCRQRGLVGIVALAVEQFDGAGADVQTADMGPEGAARLFAKRISQRWPPAAGP